MSIVSETAAREYIDLGLISRVWLNGFIYKRDFCFVTKKDTVLPEQANSLVAYVCEHYSGEWKNRIKGDRL
jgi:hypothetical protein